MKLPWSTQPYLWTSQGWLYLAVVLDLFSRKVVGWAVENQMTTRLVLDALQQAVQLRKPAPGLIYHSDRGSQYASYDYQDSLKRYGVIPSMSRKANCWDNAVCERFFRSLKHECTEFQHFHSQRQAEIEVRKYIEWFYNAKRLHSTLGYQSPQQFEAIYHRKVA